MTSLQLPRTPPPPAAPPPQYRWRRIRRAALRQSRHYALFITLGLILAVLMIYPVFSIIAAAFSPVTRDGHTTRFYWLWEVLHNRQVLYHILISFLLACVVTLLTNIIALPLALINQRYKFPLKRVLGALVLVPLVLPPFVGAIGMRQILGRFGSLTVALQHLGFLPHSVGIDWMGLGGFWACAVLITLGLYPISYLNVQASLANIDPALLEAAENLGGRPWRNFFRITLPLAMPGVFAGSTIVFIWSFTELGTPLLLDYRPVISRDIFNDLASASTGQDAQAFAKVLLVLLVSVSVYIVGKATLGRSAHAMTSRAAIGAQEKPLGWLKGLLAALPFVLVMLLAVIPHLGVVLYSFTAIAVEKSVGWGPPDIFGWYRSVIPGRYTFAGYRAVFGNPEIYGSILNSLLYASLSTIIDVLLGVGVAWILVRTKVIGRNALDALAMLPLAVPGLVMAFGYVATIPMLVRGLNWGITALGLHVQPFSYDYFRNAPLVILVAAYATRRLPYLVRSAAGGLQQTSVSLEEAAANLGAGPFRVFARITLPLIMASLIAGTLLTLAFAMLEVSDSIILAQQAKDFPIAKEIYALGTDTSGPANVRNACALGVLAMGLLVGTISAASALMGKKLGAIFRV